MYRTFLYVPLLKDKCFCERVLVETEVEILDVYSVKIGDNALYCFNELRRKFPKEISLSHGNKRYLKLFDITLVFTNYNYGRPRFYLVALFSD